MIDKSLINEEYSFTVKDANGNDLVCDTLAVLEKEDEPIVIYTDYTLDQDNKFNVYVSKVVKEGENYFLEAVDNYENIPEIREALDKVWDNQV